MNDRGDWRASWLKRVQVAAIGAAGYPLIAMLGRTLRWQVEGREHLDAVERSGHQPVMVFWHGRILGATYYFRNRGIAVMTSENFDGEWIGRIIERFGFRAVRGSTSRGGRRALLQLMREMEDGHPAGFTLDGPRGPAGRAQPGAVWLARATGNPLVPFHLEAGRYWSARSWDRTQVPKPFSKVALAIGTPITVSPDADVEAMRQIVERSLAALSERTKQMLGG